MPRPTTARPASEHLTVLARVLRQVEVDRTLSKPRAKRLKKLLMLAMAELQQEMMK